MIKTIALPVGVSYPAYLNHIPEERQKYHDAGAKLQAEMQEELNEALATGYQVLASHYAETTSQQIIFFVLHKPDDDKPDPTPTAKPHPSGQIGPLIPPY